MSLENQKGFILVLEGLVSVGKTTLGKSLEKRGFLLNKPTIFIPEYVNQEFLDLYLSDQEKYAFPYQTVILRERFNTHRRAEALAEQGYCVIIDRGLAGDLAFALMQKDRKYFNDQEWNVYWSTLMEHRDTQWRPDLIIHLYCTPEQAMERLKIRGKESEINSYTIEYFDQLQESHLRAFKLYSDQIQSAVPFLTMDWSTSSNLNSDRILPKKFLTQFENHISEKLNV